MVAPLASSDVDVSPRAGGSVGGAELADGRWLVHADSAALLSAIAAVPDDGRVIRWVVRNPRPADDQAARAAGLHDRRDVLQLRRPLPVESALVAEAPAIVVRAFRPGTDDEAAWIACNNRSFSSHPDQAGFTSARLHAAMAEPWFDAAGFLLWETEGLPGDDTGGSVPSTVSLAGFCWTKIHAAHDPPLGEIYVIGVDPDVVGRGLGGSLTLAGLAFLAERQIGVGMLYVDADNGPARRLYQRLGFALHHVDRVYESTAGPTAEPSSADAGPDDPSHAERDGGGDRRDTELTGR